MCQAYAITVSWVSLDCMDSEHVEESGVSQRESSGVWEPWGPYEGFRNPYLEETAIGQ